MHAALAEAKEAALAARAPFQWADGPLVTAMRQGDIILIDELNLAEDAVLERMNRCASGPFLMLSSAMTLWLWQKMHTLLRAHHSGNLIHDAQWRRSTRARMLKCVPLLVRLL